MHHGTTQLTVMDQGDAISKKVPEVAKLLGIGASTAWQLVHSGELASFKIGKTRLVRLSDVKAYVERLVGEERELRDRVIEKSAV